MRHSTTKPTKKKSDMPDLERSPLWDGYGRDAASFQMQSDEARGIVTVVYVCADERCEDTNTERLFKEKPIPTVLCCIKCKEAGRASGFGLEINEQHAQMIGMFPLTKNSTGKAAVN